MSIFRKKKIIITGHTGFKGSWLSCWLKILGADLYGISSYIPSQPSMYENLNKKIFKKEFDVDVRNKENIVDIFRAIKPNFVFHLAAQPLVSVSYENPSNTIMTNSIGTMNILEGLRTIKKKVTAIFVTSDKVYHNSEWIWGYREIDRLGGKDPYSASKAMAENVIYSYFNSYFRDTNTKIGIVRAGNVIGGGDWAKNRLIPDCIRAWTNRDSVKVRNPSSTRPWQHVLEPLGGYLLLAKKIDLNSHLSGEAFNFGPMSEENKTVLQVLDTSKNFFDHVNFDTHKDENTNFKEANLLKLNCDKALETINWKPILNFDETIKMTFDWYKKFYETGSKKKFNIYKFTISQINEYYKAAETKRVEWIQEI